MAEIDPYAILGVSRTAPREEIARAYRALARIHHPDAGAPPSATMSRINEAWHIVSDPGRRARWDRQHTVIEPAHWAPARFRVDEPVRRPPPKPEAPPSRMDSPWFVAGIVAGVAVLIAVVMVGVAMAAAPPGQETAAFTAPELELRYPADWRAAAGDAGQPDEHRVIGHFVSFPIDGDELCTTWGEPCTLEADEIPAGEASILFIARAGGTPPVPEPLIELPFGLDADDMIGGEPAAIEHRSLGADTVEIWWQLSPPGFPDQWIEVHAVIAGLTLEQDAIFEDIQEMLDSLRFREDRPTGQASGVR